MGVLPVSLKGKPRAGLRQLQLLLPPTINEALEAACKDHAPGKADYAVTVLVEHLQRTGFYKPPKDGAVS